MSSKRIECFFLEPTDRARVTYRRYRCSGDGESKCPHGYYHNVSVTVEEDVPFSLEPYDEDGPINGKGELVSDEQKKDPRWPKQCTCGYVFRDEDEWQINTSRYFQRTTGDKARFTLSDAPHGSMWYADWMPSKAKGPDGHCLIVRTPGGDWTVDYLSDKRQPWTRSGTPPNITASPSIAMGTRGSGKYYHGFLRGGFLEACSDAEV